MHAYEIFDLEGLRVAEDGVTPRTRSARSRTLLGLFFIQAGVNHFVMPGPYRRIVPPGIGDPATLVKISGAAEVLGGVGVFVPAARRLSGIGLIALLAAVFPANLHMARNPEKFHKIPRGLLYARLPLQPLAMVWVWRATGR
ncbi:MAG TPA: DoxX family membrane protein [Solirubrobacteraceae bacterium]|nr:DoxX family membrane protein [Solirubrobacteraceae bacterium]